MTSAEKRAQNTIRYLATLEQGTDSPTRERLCIHCTLPFHGGWNERVCRACKKLTQQSNKARWEADNPEKLSTIRIKAIRKWALNNPDKYKENARRSANRRHARKRGASTQEPYSRMQVWQSGNGICWLCELPTSIKWDSKDATCFTVDHILALALGGSDTLSNTAVAHKGCNIAKRAKTLEQLTPEWKTARRIIMMPLVEAKGLLNI